MGPKLKSKEKGPMDRFVQKKTDKQNGSTSQPPNLQPVAEPCDKLPSPNGCTSPLAQNQMGSTPVPSKPLDKQDKEPHETHSFEWCFDKKSTTFTCNKARTVEDLLQRSPQFREIAEKNQTKELVIIRDGKAITSHFPCCLIKNKQLTIKYVKAVNKQKQPCSGSVPRQRKRSSGKLVMFHLLTKGGKNVANIMRNPALKIQIQEITVYAYNGEKVKQALTRDGRLLHVVFKKNCVLSHTSTNVTTEMSNLVDDLDGKSFKITLLNKSSPPKSPPCSLEDDYMMQNESQVSDPNGNHDPPQQSTTTDSVNDNTPKEKTKHNGNIVPGNILGEIPNSKMMQNGLSLQFQHLVKGMKTLPESKLSRIQSLFRVDYGKNDQTCREVKTMKKLMDLSNSVCHVRINGIAGGSGFLLFGKFVLTNGHVLKNIYSEGRNQLDERVTVHFSYESLRQEGYEVSVEEVVGFELSHDVSGHMYDWALLKLCADQELPDVLLKHFGFLPQSGGICIIGHPNGGVKKIDPCLIIPIQAVEYPEGSLAEDCSYSKTHRHPVHLLTHQFFEHNRQTLLYDTCFYSGSSGSPVFDEHCNVVAMHSGGYNNTNARRESQNIIEFGYPLSFIIEHIIGQMVERGRFDVLKEYLACDYEHHQNIMTNLKKLVESRGPKAFQDAANKPEVTNDPRLDMFFRFLTQREEPVPMDTA